MFDLGTPGVLGLRRSKTERRRGRQGNKCVQEEAGLKLWGFAFVIGPQFLTACGIVLLGGITQFSLCIRTNKRTNI